MIRDRLKSSKFVNQYIEQTGMICVNKSFERPSWDEYFMLQAELAKLRSNCMTRQVGAVIVRKNRQLATGYNGTPPGIKNCFDGGCKRCQLRMEGKIESGASLDRCLCNHAEANAIMHCAILGIEAGVAGAVLYTTFVPCLECTKMAITIGIRKFVCLDYYPETDFGLLKEAGVEVIQLDKSQITKWAKELVSKYESI
jgi:dCMP deaminase